MTQSSSVNIYSNFSSKAYSSEDSTVKSKALGDLGSPTDINGDGSIDELENYAYELKMWLAEQRDNGVQISAEEMNTIEGYIDYCSQMLGGWDPLAELGWTGQDGSSSGVDFSDFDTNEGPEGSLTIIDGGDFSVDGSVEVIDVWGTATSPANMSVPPPCTVVFETSTDNRTGIPETVVKATVTNPAVQGSDGMPAKSVVWFHEGVPVNCHASLKGDGTSRATDATGTVTIDEWVDPAIAEEEAATAIPAYCGGEMEEIDDTTFRHTALSGEIIRFTPQPSTPEGETHDVYGDSIITLRSDYKADITYDSATQAHIITVTDPDGNKVIYRINDGSKVQLLMNDEFLTVNGEKLEEIDYNDKKNNEFWTEEFTLNDSLALDILKAKYDEEQEEVEKKEKAAEEKEKEEKVDYPDQVTDLARELGILDKDGKPDEEKLLRLLAEYEMESGVDIGLSGSKYIKNGKLTAEALEQAIEDGSFPPMRPNKDLIQFIVNNNTKLKNRLEDCKTSDKDAYMMAMSEATEILAECLSPLYPDVKITSNKNPTYWWQANDMTFDGKRFEPFVGGESDYVVGRLLEEKDDGPDDPFTVTHADGTETDYANSTDYMPGSDSRGDINSDPFETGNY
jgi:hypothetical protein